MIKKGSASALRAGGGTHPSRTHPLGQPHRQPDGTERPIVFASQTLTKSERNYAQVEKEALSLVFGVRKFHKFLYGRTFTLITDHKSLKTILGPKNNIPLLAAARMQRWAAYVYDDEFRPTGEHANADGLSCLPLSTEAAVANPEDPSVFNVTQMKVLPVKAAQIMAAMRSDAILSKVLYYLRHRWPDKVSDALVPFSRRRDELSIEGDCILWGTRVVVPTKLRERVLEELHQGHSGVVRMKALARSYV